MDPYLGEIRPTAFNFAPSGWAMCNGQLLAISQNTALFSLLGTRYGGDGRVTFALPNLMGRIPVGAGTLPGGSVYYLGDTGGVSDVTLTTPNLPAHTHTLPASTSEATPTSAPGPGVVLGGAPLPRHAGAAFYCTPANQATKPVNMNPMSNTPTGGSGPHNNMAPYLAINYIIALSGIFPQRP